MVSFQEYKRDSAGIVHEKPLPSASVGGRDRRGVRCANVK